MTLAWINVNKRLLEAVQTINKTPSNQYQNLLHKIVKTSSDDVFNTNELSNLEQSLKFSSTDVQLLVHGIDHIFKKSSQVIMKPTVLQKNLTEYLKMDPDKAEEFVKIWTETTKTEFGDLDERKKLDDVVWQLNLETNSSNSAETIVPKARLQLSLSDFSSDNAEKVTLEFKEEELLHMYNMLENVQNRLDSLHNSSK